MQAQRRSHALVLSGAVVATLAASSAFAAIPAYTGGSYTENFDSLVNSPTNTSLGSGAWQDDTNLNGFFYLQTLNAGAEGGYQRLRASSGNSGTGSMYSFGTNSTTERALGWVSSNTFASAGQTAHYLALRLRNTSADTFDNFTLKYNGEQWRNGGNTDVQSLNFAYMTDAAGLTDSGFTAVAGLNFNSPIATATAAAVDGNVAGRVAINSDGSLVVSGINWQPGQDLWLRWTDTNDPNNDHGLAIDDLDFTAGGNTTPTNASPTYNVDSDGNWSNAANWLNGAPNATAPLARLGSAITANRTVNLDVNSTVNGLMISAGKALYTLSSDNGSTLSINAGGAVTVSNGVFSPADGLPTGAHTISANLAFASDAVFHVGDLGTLNVTGNVSVGPGGGVTLVGPGSVSLPPAFTWSGPTILDRATVTLTSASQLGDGSPTNTLTIKNGAALNFAADVSMTRPVSFDAGGFTVRTDNTVSMGAISGPGIFQKVLSGSVMVNSIRTDALYIAAADRTGNTSAGVLKIAPNETDASTSVVKFLRFESTTGGAILGSLDLSDNKLIIDWDPSGVNPLGRNGVAGMPTYVTPTGSSLVETRIAVALWNAYAGGHWTGTATGVGITSSLAQTASADPVSVRSVGYADAARFFGLSGADTASWGGQTVDASSILILPTLAGDANLDGTVDADDYALTDKGYQRDLLAGNTPKGSANDIGLYDDTHSQWQDGDFNYDAVVNDADLLILDKSFLFLHPASPAADLLLANRSAQFGDAYVSSLLASVPEPTSALAACALAIPALSRRRRHA